MNRRLAGPALLLLSGLATGLVMAGERLDDSASPRQRVAPVITLSDQGRPLSETLDATGAVVRYGRIEYRLNTAAYVGRQAQVFFVIPPQIQGLRSPAGLRADWRGSGQFAEGSARPGERRLVWSGRITQPWLVETIDLTLHVDLREWRLPERSGEGFTAHFEIETQ